MKISDPGPSKPKSGSTSASGKPSKAVASIFQKPQPKSEPVGKDESPEKDEREAEEEGEDELDDDEEDEQEEKAAVKL